MRSEKQREASRINGSKSRGPITPEGKNTSKFNNLRHGLRAEQVVLPGEDPAEYEAEKRAWFDDWRPQSHTRAVLVERAAQASWRLRRSVRAEAALLRGRADAAAHAFDTERLARVDRAIGRIGDDPKGALMLLELDATGLDRLLASWGELAEALGRGPAAWDQPRYHARLMLLLGHYDDEDPGAAGEMPKASARLLASNGVGTADPLPASRREAAVEGLRGLVAEQAARLRSLRARADEPDDLRRRAADAAFAEAVSSEESRLRLRYEMALDRSLRATLGQLAALEKSGADLGGAAAHADQGPPDPPESPAESEPQVVANEHLKVDLASSAPGSLGAVEGGATRAAVAAPIRGVKAPSRPPATGGGGGSPR